MLCPYAHDKHLPHSGKGGFHGDSGVDGTPKPQASASGGLHSLGALDLETGGTFKRLRPSAHPQKSEG
jgi:hypothetical protein